jgi:hypothetical protein
MDKPLASCKGQWGRCLVKRPSRHAFVREANEKVFCAMFGCGGRCRAYTRFGFTMLQRLRHDGDRRDMFGSCLRSLHHHSLVPAAAPRFSNTPNTLLCNHRHGTCTASQLLVLGWALLGCTHLAVHARRPTCLLTQTRHQDVSGTCKSKVVYSTQQPIATLAHMGPLALL